MLLIVEEKGGTVLIISKNKNEKVISKNKNVNFCNVKEFPYHLSKNKISQSHFHRIRFLYLRSHRI